MGYMMNTVYLSGLIVDFTQPEIVEFSSGASLKKVSILISYSDPYNNKTYKIPLEVLTNETKMGILSSELRSNNTISVDARLVSTEYINKSTGKAINYLKIDPYVICFPTSGKQLIFKSRYTGNPATVNMSINNYPPYNPSVEQAKDNIRQTVESMKSQAQPPQPPAQNYPKPGQAIGSEQLDDDIPF